MDKADSAPVWRRLMKLNTLCTGDVFGRAAASKPVDHEFPATLLGQTADFNFVLEADPEKALAICSTDQSIDLVFLDIDEWPLPRLTTLLARLKEVRPRLPVVAFSDRVGERMRYIMRAGAAWHFTKYSDAIGSLAEHIHRHVFSPAGWDDVFAHYAGDEVKPRIEPGLGHADLEALANSPEEQYIIKRLFANSDVVQIFRMDEGFSGSRIYTVKPQHQLKRILKIGLADDLEAVQDKQERLIQPRLYRQVGQIRGHVVSAQHLGGACYSLAGSNRDAMTLSQFMKDPNRVRRELVDRTIQQLRDSFAELYAGSTEAELRYWAPLYSQVLPPCLTLEEGHLLVEDVAVPGYVIDAGELNTLSAVPSNAVLEQIDAEVARGGRPDVVLRGFEVAELDARQGVLYLHDSLMERYPVAPEFSGKEHPILRFKVHLRQADQALLAHPVFRRGKRVVIRGRVRDTQGSVLARSVHVASGKPYERDAAFFTLAGARFLPLLENIRYLLWEVGREDMIVPMPVIAPVVHGDLNASNILVEANHEAGVWLIDFSEARSGHVYFDLAKLEVEMRTHVFYHLFREMVEEHLWDEQTAVQCILLIEHLLLQDTQGDFEEFTARLRDTHFEWYDALYTQFPLYFEDLLYFIYALRESARALSPERFRQHYPVAVFFQSVAALKYQRLEEDPWQPWAKRLALCCALVHGKEAVAQAKRPQDVTMLLTQLRQRSAQALIAVGSGPERRYLMQWNENWNLFNLVGGRIRNDLGDRDSFARALQRKLAEELGLTSPKDYRIVRELPPVTRQQFSRRQHVFKDYEFRLFEIELLPRHPHNADAFARAAQRFEGQGENVLVSVAEIERLQTVAGRPISETARILLQEVGVIDAAPRPDASTLLQLVLDDAQPLVNRGRVKVSATLVNAHFGHMIENLLVEVLARPAYAVEPHSQETRIRELDAGQEYPLEMWLQPREEDARLSLRVTYFDTRGNEYQQLLEASVQFRSPVFALFEMDNPYVAGKPLTAGYDDLFIGRDDLFTWMAARLLGQERAASMLIVAPPRMGKTSTLHQLASGARGQPLREYAQERLIPIYLDLQELGKGNTGDLFAWLSEGVARHLRNRGIAIHAPSSWPLNGHSFPLFDQYLDEVEAAMADNTHLVLILDELEHLRQPIERGDLDPNLLPYLHSLMQHRARLSIVAAGSLHLGEDFWHLITSAADTWELAPLSRQDTERLIREPVQPALRYEDTAVELIWRLAGGHPYLTQLLCHRLVQLLGSDERRPTVIAREHVLATAQQVVEEDDHYFWQRWEALDPRHQRLLATLAELETAAGESVPEDALLPEEEETLMRLALEDLLRERLVRVAAPVRPRTHSPTGNGNDPEAGNNRLLSVSMGLVTRWILEKQPLAKADTAIALAAA